MSIGWHLPGHVNSAGNLSVGNMTAITSKQMSDTIGIIAIALILNNPSVHPRLASAAADNLMAGLCRLSANVIARGEINVIDVAARKPHLRQHERIANGVWQVRARASGEATRA